MRKNQNNQTHNCNINQTVADAAYYRYNPMFRPLEYVDPVEFRWVYVHAYTRVRLGRLEYVRAHWRRTPVRRKRRKSSFH